MSKLEDELAFAIMAVGLPTPVREFRFHPTRRWRADFAWPDLMTIVEVQGGTFTGGRHVRPLGYEKDLEKANAAILLGYRYLSFTQRQIHSGVALEMIESILKSASTQPIVT